VVSQGRNNNNPGEYFPARSITSGIFFDVSKLLPSSRLRGGLRLCDLDSRFMIAGRHERLLHSEVEYRSEFITGCYGAI